MRRHRANKVIDGRGYRGHAVHRESCISTTIDISMTSPKKQSSKRTIDQVEEKQNEETKNEAKKEEDKPTAGEPDKDASNHKMNEKEEPVSKKAKTNAKSGESKENSANSAKSGSKRATRSSAKSGTTQHQPKAIIQFLLSDEAITMLDQLETNDADDLQFPRDR